LDELRVLGGLEEERDSYDKDKLMKEKVISDLERATLLRR
jgi:soluble P-type ATPase